MYQNLTNEMRNGFKPLLNIFEIQSKTAQQILQDQIAFANECVNVSARAADTLSDSHNASDYFSVPLETTREIGQKWMDAAGRQWDMLVEAGNTLNGEFANAAQEFESAVDKASQEVKQSVGQASSKAKSASKSK
ncbi:MAG TPA: phasin family protein [Salinisphaeraceae bacterium]|nr:phasin family protein [Salinisphaeraceae bacterium]